MGCFVVSMDHFAFVFLFVFMSNVQVNIFQSYRDGATASWVFTSTMGSKCAMFKDMKMVSPVGVEPST